MNLPLRGITGHRLDAHREFKHPVPLCSNIGHMLGNCEGVWHFRIPVNNKNIDNEKILINEKSLVNEII